MINILGNLSQMGMNAPASVDALMEMQRWANNLIAQQQQYLPYPAGIQFQSPYSATRQHPLERGWSQHHLDALLDVELGL
jgi:hypothetical protein